MLIILNYLVCILNIFVDNLVYIVDIDYLCSANHHLGYI